MSARVVVSPISKSWKELYKAALFETDKNKLSERIAYAEWALALRARELFHAGSEHLQERQAVDTAIYTLNVLRSCATWDKGKKATDGNVIRWNCRSACFPAAGFPQLR